MLGPKNKFSPDFVHAGDERELIFSSEDLKEIYSLFLKLVSVFPNELPGLESYTGIGKTVGVDDRYQNSLVTAYQLKYALAVTRHPLIIEMAANNESSVNAAKFVENKIMSGMRTLDLGCGWKPVFARVCRRMGADVWTVDSIPSKDFVFDKTFPDSERELEVTQHIQLELFEGDPQQNVKVINSKSGGRFNLITEANLKSDGFMAGRVIAMPLLRTGGIYDSGIGSHKAELKE